MNNSSVRLVGGDKYLDDFIRKEVFIITGAEDEEESEIKVMEDFESVKEYLVGLLGTMLNSEIRIFHGVLAPAAILPSSFKNKNAFLIAVTEHNDEAGYVAEVSDDLEVADLAKMIEELILFGGPGRAYDVSDIEDIYVLYGYQMQIENNFLVMEDQIDEETILVADSILDELVDIKTKWNKVKVSE